MTISWGKLGLMALVLAAVVPACTCGSPADDVNSTVPGSCQTDPPLIATQKTDILFVIDNSRSMREEQDEVANELPAFIEELTRDAGVGQDFRVGVVTTGVYQKVVQGTVTSYDEYPDESGKLRPVTLPDGGVLAGAERYLEDDDPQLLEKFRLLIRQGITGSGQETPFEAVRLAVSPPLSDKPVAEGGNKEFYRDGARLLVVVLSDEEDCSEMERPPEVYVGSDTSREYCTEQSTKLTTVDEYFDVYRNLKDSLGQPRPVLWAAIAPVSTVNKEATLVIDSSGMTPTVRNIDCPTSQGPGIRQREMAQKFDPTLKNLDSICKPSFRQSLIDIAAIANNTQILDVSGVPDPRLLQAEITRANGDIQLCTLANGGIQFQPAEAEAPARVLFQPSCPRNRDDLAITLKMFCAQ